MNKQNALCGYFCDSSGSLSGRATPGLLNYNKYKSDDDSESESDSVEALSLDSIGCQIALISD